MWRLRLALLGGIFLLVGGSPSFAQSLPTFLGQWGTFGSADGQFNHPYGVASTGTSLYVAEFDGNRVQQFDTSGAFLTKWGTEANLPHPTAVAVSPNGDVYVAQLAQVREFSSGGALVRVWGSSGSGDGQFSGVSGIAIDPDGNVFVADTNNRRVQKFSSTGAFISKWGTAGTGNGQFQRPYGIATDTQGNVYVGDEDNTNAGIQKFANDGTFLLRWGTTGTTQPGEFNNLAGLAVNLSGNVIAADMSNGRIQVFTSTGQFILMFGSIGAGPGQFTFPKGVTSDSQGNIYVADTNNDRIQKFGPGGTPAQSTSWGRLKASYR